MIDLSHNSSSTVSDSSVSVRHLPQAQGTSPLPPSSYDSLDLVKEMVRAADDRKAGDITVLNVTDISYLAEYFIVVTGFSNSQIRAIARSVEDQVAEVFQRHPEQAEGLKDGGWILLDYGEAIIHIFLPHEREFYDLEAFWGHAEKLDVAKLLAEE